MQHKTISAPIRQGGIYNDVHISIERTDIRNDRHNMVHIYDAALPHNAFFEHRYHPGLIDHLRASGYYRCGIEFSGDAFLAIPDFSYATHGKSPQELIHAFREETPDRHILIACNAGNNFLHNWEITLSNTPPFFLGSDLEKDMVRRSYTMLVRTGSGIAIRELTPAEFPDYAQGIYGRPLLRNGVPCALPEVIDQFAPDLRHIVVLPGLQVRNDRSPTGVTNIFVGMHQLQTLIRNGEGARIAQAAALGRPLTIDKRSGIEHIDTMLAGEEGCDGSLEKAFHAAGYAQDHFTITADSISFIPLFSNYRHTLISTDASGRPHIILITAKEPDISNTADPNLVYDLGLTIPQVQEYLHRAGFIDALLLGNGKDPRIIVPEKFEIMYSGDILDKDRQRTDQRRSVVPGGMLIFYTEHCPPLDG